MGNFVDAYDTQTGKKLPYLVPEHHIDHPILGRRLSRLPSQVAAEVKSVESPKPASHVEVEIPVTESGTRKRGAKKKED